MNSDSASISVLQLSSSEHNDVYYNNFTNNNGYDLQVASSLGNDIKHNTFDKNSINSYVFYFSTSSGAIVENNTITNAGTGSSSWGYYLSSIKLPINLTGTNLVDSENASEYFVYDKNNTIFEDLNHDGSVRVLNLGNFVAYNCDNLIVKNSNFSEHSACQVRMQDVTNITVENNNISKASGTGYGIRVSQFENLAIKNNTVKAVDNSAIDLYVESVDNSQDAVIEHNTISCGSGDGIMLRKTSTTGDAKNVTVQHNTGSCTSTSGYFVYLDVATTGNTLYNITVYNNTVNGGGSTAGIYSENPCTNITNNTISNCGSGTGIMPLGRGDYQTIYGNTISDCRYGMYLASEYNNISKNNFTDNSDWGIHVISELRNNISHDNLINGKEPYYYYNEPGVVIEDLDLNITQGVSSGVVTVVDSRGVTIRNNQLMGSGASTATRTHGIGLYNVSDSSIANNTINKSEHSIYASGQTYGYDCNNNTIENNTFNANLGNYQIYLNHGAKNNTIKNNHFYDGKGYGVGLDSTYVANSVRNNTIANNDFRNHSQAIYLTSVQYNTIENNSIDQCRMFGISLYYLSQYNVIKHNNFTNFTGTGAAACLGCGGSNAHSVIENRFHDNYINGTYYGIKWDDSYQNNTAYNNEIYHASSYALMFDPDKYEQNVYNNTICYNKYGMSFSTGRNLWNVKVHNNSFCIINDYPLNSTVNVSSMPLISFNATNLADSSSANCTAVIDGTANGYNDTMAADGSNQTIQSSNALIAGNHSLEITCTDSYDNSAVYNNITFEVQVSCGMTLNADTMLANNLTGTGTCFTIGSDSITLDCAGYAIIGNESGYGVFATGRENIVVKNCEILNFSTGVLFNYTNHSLIDNNTIMDNLKDGVDVEYSYRINVTNNTIDDNTEYGLSNYQSNYSRILNNNIIGNGWDGLSSGGTGGGGSDFLEIKRNTINNNSWNGFALARTSNSIIESNTIKYNTDAGWLIDYTEHTNMSHNIINNNTDNGVFVRNGNKNMTWLNNTINNNNGYGIFLRYTYENNFTNNNVSYNGYDGFYLNKNNWTTIHNNTANFNGWASGWASGFLFSYGYKNTITSNTANNNSDYGIYVWSINGADRMNLSYNTASGNNYEGFYLETLNTSTIANNTANNNGYEGIYLWNVDNTNISGNTANNNTLDGFYLGNVNDSTLTLNTAQDNTNSDINITTSGNVIINDSTFYSYAFDQVELTIVNSTAGELRFLNRSVTQTGSDLGQDIQISTNRTFVNSTNAPGLNTTANITLYGITLSIPQVEVDPEDDGTFTTCTASTEPSCYNLSYSGNVFVFNTTHFTTFRLAELDVTTPNITLIDPVNNTLNLTNNTIWFTYNVSDYSSIANCSLIINNAVNQTNNSINKSLASITFVQSMYNAQYNWSVNCTDNSPTPNEGASEVRNLTIYTNIPPVVEFSQIDPTQMAEDSYNDTINLSLYVEDSADSDEQINWSCTDNETDVTSTENNVTKILNVSAANNFVGQVNVTCTAHDTQAGTDTDSFIVNVTPVNDAPFVNFSSIDTVQLVEDNYNDTINLSSYVTDVDNTDEEINWSCTDNETYVTTTEDNSTKILNVSSTNSFTGTVNITCIAYDLAAASSIDSFIVNVTPVNDAPDVDLSGLSISIQVNNYDDTTNLSSYVLDVDNTDEEINWSCSSNSTSVADVNVSNSTKILNITAGSTAGTANITCTGYDLEPLSDTDSFIVTVTTAPVSPSTGGGGGTYRPPTIVPTPDDKPGMCIEDWVCDEWSRCLPEGFRTRPCYEWAHCGTDVSKPLTVASCIFIAPVIEKPTVEVPAGPICGNGVCEAPEDYILCPSDCPRPSAPDWLLILIYSMLGATVAISTIYVIGIGMIGSALGDLWLLTINALLTSTALLMIYHTMQYRTALFVAYGVWSFVILYLALARHITFAKVKIPVNKFAQLMEKKVSGTREKLASGAKEMHKKLEESKVKLEEIGKKKEDIKFKDIDAKLAKKSTKLKELNARLRELSEKRKK